MPTVNQSTSKQQAQRVWTDPLSFASTLLVLFVDTYGTEAFSWAGETIKMEIEDDFEIRLPAANLDRLMVAISLLTTDDFYWSLPEFIRWCNILSGDSVGEAWDLADAGDIAWGVSEALMLYPPEGEEPFTAEIRGYIGAILDREGIINPPDVLRLAVRSSDLQQTVEDDFSDDPVMFSAIYGFEAAKTTAIEDYVKSQLTSLVQQLQQLPAVAAAEDFLPRLLALLGKEADE